MDEIKTIPTTEVPAVDLEIVLDDGLIRVPIKNLYGEEIGVFQFRPTDIGIIDRYEKTVASLDDVVAPLESANIQADGTAEEADEASFAAIKEATERLYAACDYMFGGNMSEAFFGKMHPFSPVQGRFFCEAAIEAVGKIIGQYFDAETSKVNSRVTKYTHGYAARTGKHKDGRK